MKISYPRKQGELVDSSEIELLFKWAEQVGIQINPKLQYPVKYPPGYFGMKTQLQIPPSETLITVPNNALLSTQIAKTPELSEIYESHPDLFLDSTSTTSVDYLMITYLLLEFSKGPSSYWYPYLNSLPKNPENLTDWKEIELIELQDSDVVTDVLDRQARYEIWIDTLISVLQKYPEKFGGTINVEKVHWSWKIVSTRAFGKCIPYSSLIPVADLINHDNVLTNYYYGTDDDLPPDLALGFDIRDTDSDSDEDLYEDPEPILLNYQNLHKINFSAYGEQLDEEKTNISKKILSEATIKDANRFVLDMNFSESLSISQITEDPNKRFRMVTGKNERFEGGAEILISYGNYSNRNLLMSYGFANKINKYNYARIKIPLRNLLTEQQWAKMEETYSSEALVAFKIKKSKICDDLLSVLRCLLWDINKDTPMAFFNPTSIENEEIIFQQAISIVRNCLDEFPTTLDEDLGILNAPKSHRHYFALIYRIGVKDCLQSQLSLLRMASLILRKIKSGEEFLDAITSIQQCEEVLNVSNRQKMIEYLSSYLGYLKVTK
ncbi:unnamed protein product [Blepharisma stoltei]|uniref:Rubisco LSMT substrate-binding domain-containing protein n=1 Tax=Blepharisma stoltei TaxID=1481888 RepID=A0AAU9K4P1_9CILI|nr:unnamed protein product [Blepharisma stoltei]